jgi:hypothetical protein
LSPNRKLVCGILLVAVSPFFIFYTEIADQPYPYGSGINPPPGTVYLNYNSYYIFFGMFLLATGIVLVVASYYHREGSELTGVANDEQRAKTD